MRTTPDAVQGILGGHYNGTQDLMPFIQTAASLTDRISAADSGSLLGSNDLEVIERWLSAHFYGHADQFLSQKSTGKASGTFQGRTGMGLNSTQYGQTAMALDVTGTLAQLEQQATTGKKVAGGVWLGTRYRNDYSQRSSDQ